MQNVKAIPGECQHAIVATDTDKKKIRYVVIKTCTEQRKISLLKDVKIRKRFKGKANKLVVFFERQICVDTLMMACHWHVMMCMRRGRSKGDTWW